MNAPEKLAALYLRLNGFFLLPRFTVFDGRAHTDIDILGLRIRGAAESVGGFTLPQDPNLISLLDADPLVLAVAQVKGGETEPKHTSTEHLAYARRLAPGARQLSIAFHTDAQDLPISPDPADSSVLSIRLQYADQWIRTRIAFMQAERLHLTKIGSWTWSESFLSDYLYLYKLHAG